MRKGDFDKEIAKLQSARRAFWEALCDAQSKLTDHLEPVVCECGSRRLQVENTRNRSRAVTRRRVCLDCGYINLTAEFTIARHAPERKRGPVV